METDKPAESEAKAGEAAEGGAEGGEAAKKEAPKVEPSSYSLANPCRVTPGQAKHVAFKSDSRWGQGGGTQRLWLWQCACGWRSRRACCREALLVAATAWRCAATLQRQPHAAVLSCSSIMLPCSILLLTLPHCVYSCPAGGSL